MIVAATSWAEAVVVIAIIVMITIISTGVVWQTLATGWTGVSAKRDGAYRKLAEDAAELQRSTVDALERTTTELGELNRRTAELERLLKEVD